MTEARGTTRSTAALLREPAQTARATDALGTPVKVEMAARQAGVELRVTGPESCEQTGLAARVRRSGAMPPELAEAIWGHRVGLIIRLLAREPVIGDAPDALASLLRERRGGHATLGDVWPEACLAAQAKFGHRCARLYPLLGGAILIGGEDGGVVGTLHQAMAGEAMVRVESDPPVHPFGDESKPVIFPARFVPIGRVWPTVPGSASGPRSRRTRPHGGEDDLRIAAPVDVGGKEG